MSRSRKKTPVCGNTTASSDKWFKRWANRLFRRKSKQAILQEEECPTNMDEVADSWLSDKDGKKYFNPEEHMELMRK